MATHTSADNLSGSTSVSNRVHPRYHQHRTISNDAYGFLPEPSTFVSADGGCDVALAETFLPRGDENFYEQPRVHDEERTSVVRSRASVRLTSETVDEAVIEDSPEAHDESTSLLSGKDEDEDEDEFSSKPWYRRPSPWWLIPTLLMSSTLGAMSMAPKVEVFNKLVCHEHRPEYSSHRPPILPGIPKDDSVLAPGPGPIVAENPAEAENSFELLDFVQNSYKWAPEPPATAWTGPIKSPSALCRADPVVQAEVAKITTAMTTIMGALAVLTTGFWSTKSDLWGRTPILAISIAGVLVTDANFLLVAHRSEYLPGGYRFLIVGPLIDGLVGAMPTATAAAHAYVGDSTPSEARGRMFSLNAGLVFTGLALGPYLGALLIRYTEDLLSVFYLTTFGHILYAIAIMLIIPESLSKAARRRIAKKNEMRKRARHEANEEISRLRVGPRSVMLTIWKVVRPIFGFLSPLALFAPTKPEMGQPGYASGKRDWNLTFMATCYGVAGLMIGLYSMKFQYAQKTFGWDAQRLGYWLSYVGVARAFHLVIILPLIFKYLRPKPQQAIALPVMPSEPLQRPNTPAPRSKGPTPPPTADIGRASQAASLKSHKHTPQFDLIVARVSIGIEFLCEIGQTLAIGPKTWTAATLLGAFGGGYSPAMQSLALGLLKNEDETGRLFGALSVMSALCTQVLGPGIFGMLYALTVGVFPKAIFVAACCCAATALLCLFCVRIRSDTPDMVVLAAGNGRDSAPVILHGEPARRVLEGEPSRGRTMSRGNGKAKVIV